MRIVATVLAGGESRRMGGQDKAMQLLAGRPLIDHVLDRLTPQVDTVLISANRDMSRYSVYGCEVVPDERPQGPLSGVLACLRRSASLGATHLVSCPVDVPFLPGDLVPRLLLASEASPSGLALAADETGDHPASALWPVGITSALAAFLAAGEAKVTKFTDAHNAARARFTDPNAFLNLNSFEDLNRAEALIAARS